MWSWNEGCQWFGVASRFCRRSSYQQLVAFASLMAYLKASGSTSPMVMEKVIPLEFGCPLGQQLSRLQLSWKFWWLRSWVFWRWGVEDPQPWMDSSRWQAARLPRRSPTASVAAKRPTTTSTWRAGQMATELNGLSFKKTTLTLQRRLWAAWATRVWPVNTSLEKSLRRPMHKRVYPCSSTVLTMFPGQTLQNILTISVPSMQRASNAATKPAWWRPKPWRTIWVLRKHVKENGENYRNSMVSSNKYSLCLILGNKYCDR